MVTRQTPALVFIIMLALVGQVSSKIKQLQSTQQRGHHPKQDKVGLRHPHFKHVEKDGHHHNLPYRKVIADELNIPGNETAVVIIRVIVGMHVAMVFMVLGVKLRVPKRCV